jgi:hypothetical protein
MRGTDGGSHWQEAEIFNNPNSSQVWAFWKFVWKNAPKRKQTLKARATGYHTIEVTVG